MYLTGLKSIPGIVYSFLILRGGVTPEYICPLGTTMYDPKLPSNHVKFVVYILHIYHYIDCFLGCIHRICIYTNTLCNVYNYSIWINVKICIQYKIECIICSINISKYAIFLGTHLCAYYEHKWIGLKSMHRFLYTCFLRDFGCTQAYKCLPEHRYLNNLIEAQKTVMPKIW